MSDFIELGDSGLIPVEDGWYLDTKTGNRISPEGLVYSPANELIWDPNLDDS